LAWLYAEVNAPAEDLGWRVRVTGTGVKLTVFFEGRIVGRLWLPGGDERPVMTGGSPDSFWLPAPWFREGGAASSLVILAEAVVSGETAVIDEITFHTAGRPVTREQEGRR
jgi:beta-galactosidase